MLYLNKSPATFTLLSVQSSSRVFVTYHIKNLVVQYPLSLRLLSGDPPGLCQFLFKRTQFTDPDPGMLGTAVQFKFLSRTV